MTRHDDPDFRAREPVSSETIFTGLVLGGLVGLGAIFALFMFVGSDRGSTTAERPAVSAPATTGQDSSQGSSPRGPTSPSPR